MSIIIYLSDYYLKQTMSTILTRETMPKTIDQLLSESDRYLLPTEPGEIMTFEMDEEADVDVYNITAPFIYEGKLLIAGRADRRNDELHSKTHFFRHLQKSRWVHDKSLPSLNLQDPFVSQVHDLWVVGGVRVYPAPDHPNAVAGWDTQIYAGPDLHHLDLLTVGPYMMKDIRLTGLPNGDIAIFTRPQGEKAGVGKIGFTIVHQLEDITAKVIAEAPIIPELFASDADEWGGVNEAQVAKNGFINAAGHIARHAKTHDNKPRPLQYYGLSFILDPVSRSVFQEKIIARRDCFPHTDTKKPDTEDVIFTGGIRTLGGLATWYGGVSDTSAGRRAKFPNPYLQAAA
jgi:hypothetical protein